MEELSIPLGVYCLSWSIKNRQGVITRACQYFSTKDEALHSAKVSYLYDGWEDGEMTLTKLIHQNEAIKSNTFFWEIIQMDFSHLKDKVLSKTQREDYPSLINNFFGINR